MFNKPNMIKWICTTLKANVVWSIVYKAMMYEASFVQRCTRQWPCTTDFFNIVWNNSVWNNSVWNNSVWGNVVRGSDWLFRTTLSTLHEVLLYTYLVFGKKLRLTRESNFDLLARNSSTLPLDQSCNKLLCSTLFNRILWAISARNKKDLLILETKFQIRTFNTVFATKYMYYVLKNRQKHTIILQFTKLESNLCYKSL